MKKPKTAISWSGGKDSSLAFHRARRDFSVEALVTMLTEDGSRSRSHGLRPEVLQRQADLLGLPLVFGRASWQGYEAEFLRVLRQLHAAGFTHMIFGDIFLDPHKQWVERVCAEANLQALEPLWGEETCLLADEFLNCGGKAIIVATRATKLGPEWLGRELSPEILDAFRERGVDPCGEHGEYHTLVTNLPGFAEPLRVKELARLSHEDCWMMDLAAEPHPP